MKQIRNKISGRQEKKECKNRLLSNFVTLGDFESDKM